MNEVELARALALLGAESTLATPETEVIDAHTGWTVHAEKWAALGRRMRDDPAAAEGPLCERLMGKLGLDEAGRWLVALCAAVELFPDAAAAVSLINEDERAPLVTPTVLARLLRSSLGIPFLDGLRAALPGGRAERLGLVERVEGGAPRPLAQQSLRVTAAELRAQLGEEESSSSLLVWREPAPARPVLSRALVDGAAALLAERGVLCLRASTARAGRQLALDLAAVRGTDAFLVVAADDLPDATEIGRLRGALVIVDLTTYATARAFPLPFVRRLAADLSAVVVVLPWNAATADLPSLDVEPLALDERRRLWKLALEEAGLDDELAVPSLSRRFRVSLEEARAAVRGGRDAARVQSGKPTLDLSGQDIAEQVLAQGSRRMGRMVSRLRGNAHLEDLVCPSSTRRQLEDIIGWQRASARVTEEWMVGARSGMGRGLTCLFSGQPGTGKTFAALCLASTLGLNLYRIDLSQVVSKYIGETEKALSRVFDEAEAGHGLLLFDEADALFGKRSDVKDAHDRYANIEVGYLLQRVEVFEGISILTTNLRNNLDQAFLRRLRFVIEFPMPDTGMRRTLWEQALPDREHWEPGLSLDPFIERFPLSGGNIHNVGLQAAHLAAAQDDGVLRVEHLVRATFRELEKSGLSRSRDEFGPLAAHLIREAA